MRASSPGVVDPARTGHFRLTPTVAAGSAGAYASAPDLVNAMTGKPAAPGTAAAALRYDLRRNQTVTFTAQVADRPVPSAPRPAAGILRDLDTAKARLAASQLRGTGPAGRAITAMRDAIALNTNYDEVHRRSFVMWGLGGGGDWIFTGWDSGWDAITAAAVDPALALDHERDLFDSGGPRYDQANAGAMHAYAVWRLYRDFGDRALVEQAYPVLVAFFDKLVEWDVNRDGLLESPYGGDRVGGRGNHLGLDDSPQYANYQRVAKTGGSGDPRDNTNLTDVALNSCYALFAEALGGMAEVLGEPADQQRFARVRDTVRDGVNTLLWNEERGLYLNRYPDGTWNPPSTTD
ncbi:Protein of unknown function, DUF608 [Goodfellowiella coeruleoviolacea]|uniref:Mannosylglycerate hydrolase MGH1-like glycoside hydrolase domain-containing protein n=1 Tax=Goodfellowiella coeruleoviolacea TaxID=334858 RepID=A0AAE3KD18_9PSEU|nr:Protein of unknown function, DUF608 [Goodfellowiella coeruleoviolacea]